VLHAVLALLLPPSASAPQPSVALAQTAGGVLARAAVAMGESAGENRGERRSVSTTDAGNVLVKGRQVPVAASRTYMAATSMRGTSTREGEKP
jgi:hypothetical protein